MHLIQCLMSKKMNFLPIVKQYSNVKKRRLAVNWDQCLCHGYSSYGGKLERFTQKSWDRLCMAAKRRQDDVYYSLHGQCAQIFPIQSSPDVRKINTSNKTEEVRGSSPIDSHFSCLNITRCRRKKGRLPNDVGGKDAFAGDVLVHRSCRSSLSRNIQHATINVHLNVSGDAYDTALKIITSEIEKNVMRGLGVMLMGDAVKDRPTLNYYFTII